jgi:hypothetical protein
MVIMNGVLRHRGVCSLGFLAALLISAVSVQADPIVVGSGSLFAFGTISAITGAILVEAVCIILLLRRSRTPRLFLLWIMGMHLLTYPIFLGMVWFSVGLRPELAVGFGEGMIVLIEGSLIYYLCRLAPSAKAALPVPSVGKALLVSLLGNICSAAAFPLLTFLNAWMAYTFHRSGMD